MSNVKTCGEQAMAIKKHYESLNADATKLMMQYLGELGMSVTDLSGVSNLTDSQTLMVRDSLKLCNEATAVCNEMLDLQLKEAQQLDRILEVAESIDKKLGAAKK